MKLYTLPPLYLLILYDLPSKIMQAYDGAEESDASVGNYNRGAVSDVAELMERRQIRHSVKQIIKHLEVHCSMLIA